MMDANLWIPTCGDSITLTEDWSFTLKEEYRNRDFYYVATGQQKQKKSSSWKKIGIVLPKGTELVFDRLYIRQAANEFASATFMIKNHPTDDSFIGSRFWTNLADVNKIVFDVKSRTSNNPIGRFSANAYKADAKARKDPNFAKKLAEKRATARREQSMFDTLRVSMRGNLKTFLPVISAQVLAERPSCPCHNQSDILQRIERPFTYISWTSKSEIRKHFRFSKLYTNSDGLTCCSVMLKIDHHALRPWDSKCTRKNDKTEHLVLRIFFKDNVATSVSPVARIK